MAQAQLVLHLESLRDQPAVFCRRAGFETCTIILDGKMEHRDSYGNQVHPRTCSWRRSFPCPCTRAATPCCLLVQVWHRPGCGEWEPAFEHEHALVPGVDRALACARRASSGRAACSG